MLSLYYRKSIRYVILAEDPNNPYSESLAASFGATFESLGGTVTSVVYCRICPDQLSQGGKPLTDFVNQIQQKIDLAEQQYPASQVAVYFAGYADDFASFRAHLLQGGTRYSQVTMMGGDGLDEYSPNSSGTYYTGFYFTAFSDLGSIGSTNSPVQTCFVNQYRELIGQTGSFSSNDLLVQNDAVLAYDATSALLNAYRDAVDSTHLAASGASERQAIQRQLMTVNFTGLTGQITMGPDRYPTSKAVYVEKYTLDGGVSQQRIYGDPPPGAPSPSQFFPPCPEHGTETLPMKINVEPI